MLCTSRLTLQMLYQCSFDHRWSVVMLCRVLGGRDQDCSCIVLWAGWDGLKSRCSWRCCPSTEPRGQCRAPLCSALTRRTVPPTTPGPVSCVVQVQLDWEAVSEAGETAAVKGGKENQAACKGGFASFKKVTLAASAPGTYTLRSTFGTSRSLAPLPLLPTARMCMILLMRSLALAAL